MSKRINKTRLVACTPQPDGTVHRYPLRRQGGMWWWSATRASSHIYGVESSLAEEEGGWLEREPNPEYVRQQARPGLWMEQAMTSILSGKGAPWA